MPKYDLETIPVCLNCDRNNLTKNCNKCGVAYCKHYSSITDTRFCANCVSNIELRETIIEKEIEHVRADGSVTFSRKFQARKITMLNVDWLFINKAIEDSTDAEIDATIEYHASIKDLMLMERASRQLERSRKLASIKIVHSQNKSQHKVEQDAAKKGKKSKLKEREITQDDLMAAIALLAKSMTPEQLTELLKGKK